LESWLNSLFETTPLLVLGRGDTELLTKGAEFAVGGASVGRKVPYSQMEFEPWLSRLGATDE
jgi:hypothetical protein